MIIGKGTDNIDIELPKSAYDEGKDIDSSTFKAYLIAIVRDSKGNIIQVHRQKSHSPTSNFIGLILPLTWFNSNNTSYTITNMGGSTFSYKPALGPGISCISYPNIGNNCPTYFAMIQVGSGSQSNPYTATKLAAPIANGSGTGQLIYEQIAISPNVAVSGGSAYFYITQTFYNVSGGTINITEVGIVIYLIFATAVNCTTSLGNTLMWYDVLSSPISIPNGGSVVIYYTFTVNP